MGYDTSLNGSFRVTPPLELKQVKYLQAFNGTRRMKRDPKICGSIPDPVRAAVGLPLGAECEFFVGSTAESGQDFGHLSVVNSSAPPRTQPGLWCPWTCSNEGNRIEWDGGEKPYAYVEWLEYLLVKFLRPWGRTLEGTVQWEGEEQGDVGMIVVTGNKIAVKHARIAFEED